MEEREQRRRCRGQNVLGERHLLQEASCSIPRALAMTDAREIHEAAEAWRVSLPLEHGEVRLNLCSRRDSLSFAPEIPANESHKVALRHSDIATLWLSFASAWAV